MADFPLHTLETAPDASRAAMQEAKERFGFIPNLYGKLAHAPAALNAYHEVSKAFASSSLTPAEQQVVLLTVSRYHECHYCVAAHSMVGGMVGLSEDAVTALRDGRPLADARLEALRRFTLTLVKKRGWADPEDVDAFRDAGFTETQILEVLAGITQKTLSNYTNHLTDTPLDEAMQPFAWEPASARS